MLHWWKDFEKDWQDSITEVDSNEENSYQDWKYINYRKFYKVEIENWQMITDDNRERKVIELQGSLLLSSLSSSSPLATLSPTSVERSVCVSVWDDHSVSLRLNGWGTQDVYLVWHGNFFPKLIRVTIHVQGSLRWDIHGQPVGVGILWLTWWSMVGVAICIFMSSYIALQTD